MKLLHTIFYAITGISTIGAFGFALYVYFHKDGISLEIVNTSAEQLTTSTSNEDLKVQYFYKDTIPVNNLWKVQYTINNIGDATLIGFGDGKQLLNDNLPIYIREDSTKIYKMDITRSNNGAELKGNEIYFKQWRSKEFIEITAFVESVECPTLYINDRDIIDVNVKYTPYNIDDTDNKHNNVFSVLMSIISGLLGTLIIVIASLTNIKHRQFFEQLTEQLRLINIEKQTFNNQDNNSNK